MNYNQLYRDQVAVVTGGRSGIGYAIAEALIQQGAKVIICSRNERLLIKAHQELCDKGPCSMQVCDIRKSEDIAALVTFIKDTYGRLDILINNAGGQFPALGEMINDKGWNAVINNNLNGTFYMMREMANAFFIPQKSGVITNIIVSLYRGYPGMAHTAAARGGVEALSRTLAIEWSEYGIRINCIAPGIIDSSGLSQYPQEIQDTLSAAAAAIPLKRFGQVEEVANAAVFLSGPMASYTTGITLYVDGAQHLNYDQMGLPKVIKGYLGR